MNGRVESKVWNSGKVVLMGIRETKMMGRHDIVTMQEVKYLNNVTDICCFCSALGFSKWRRCKRRYIKTSLVDEILASFSPTLSSYNLVLKTFTYALDQQIPLYHMDQGIPFADSMPRSASIDTTYMEERSVLSP